MHDEQAPAGLPLGRHTLGGGLSIQALPDQVGIALFEQGERCLTLTEAGARYLAEINESLAKLESVTARLQVHRCRSTICVNAPPFFANELLLRRLASFTRSRKETHFRVETRLSVLKSHAPEADLSTVESPQARLARRPCPAYKAAWN